ncbi:MAG: lycopene cyclase domain-containing protein [Actinobacteria bacterium]|nr:MAG: lycopene cyclase domain-containing protein [Actinomycetota bacterium]
MTSLVLIFAVVWDLFIVRTRLLGRRVFWAGYAIIFAFQLLINGWLTYRSVFIYDESAILGTRFLYEPVEDLVFGFSLVLTVQSMWVFLGRRGIRN